MTLKSNVSSGDLTTPDQKYGIKGMVRNEKGKGVPKLAVKVFEKLLRDEKLLGETVSYKNGFYELTYQAPKINKHYKKEFAIIVKVLKGDKEWLISAPIFNPRSEEWVNFMEGGIEYKGDSEYEKTIEKILLLVDDVQLTQLVENDEKKDISYLAGRTELDKQEIMMLVVAHHLKAITNVEPEVFYALFKNGLPSNLPDSLLARTFKFTKTQQLVDRLLSGILAVDPDTVKSTLLRSIEGNVIPIGFKKHTEDVLENLQNLRLNRTLEQPILIGKSSFKSLLGATTLKKENYNLFAKLYNENNGLTARFWKALEKEKVSEAQLKDVKLTLNLGFKIRNHLPLLKTLKKYYAEKTYTHPRELAQWEQANWEAAIRASTTETEKGYPPNIEGDTEDEKIKTYARHLTERFTQAYPTAALLGFIKRGENLPLAQKAGVLKFFEKNANVNLKSLHIDRYLKDNKSALEGIEKPEPVIKEVKMVQRALQLAPNAHAANALLELNLHSAQKIYALGKSRFMRDVTSTKKMSKAVTEQVYANAELKYAVVLARLMEYNFAFNRVLPKAIMATATQEIIKAKKIEEDYPSLRVLFGSLDFCDCEHCQSVYSPASYLVDILAFLKERDAKTPGKKVKDILFKRRPDIGEIDLNCKNTNTPLPYIDLVNEVLEDEVAPLQVYTLPASVEPHLVEGKIKAELLAEIRNKGLQVSEEAVVAVIKEGELWGIKDNFGYYKVRKGAGNFTVKLSRQTFGTAPELLAHPEYINAEAYDMLKTARYPMSLPFDLWWEEARTYLSHLDIKRYQLMEAFQDRKSEPEIPNNKHIAAEYFGINEAEQQIICTSDEANQAVYWKSNTPLTELAQVSAFIKKSGFVQEQGKEYRRLLELLAARFVNPEENKSIIVRKGEECNTETQTIEPLSVDKLDRMHRFIRLWRKTGWKMWELDKLSRSEKIGNSELDEDCLVQLKLFKELQERLKLSVEQLLAFYEPLNTEVREIAGEREEPLYARLFLNKTIINPINEAFEVHRVENLATAQTLSDHAATVLAAIAITEEDFMLLAAKTDGKLTLPNLSFLYRYALLAKKLKIRIKDLRLMMQLVGIADPFENLEGTKEFLKHHDAIKKSKFTVRELEYLLTSNPDSPMGMSTELVIQHLEQMRTNIQKTKDAVYNSTNIQKTKDAVYNSGTTPLESIQKNLANFDQFKDAAYLQAAIDLINGDWKGTPDEEWKDTDDDRDGFIEEKFAEFTDVAKAKAKLGDLTGVTDAEKEPEINERYDYVLSSLYRYHVINTVIETLSKILKIEDKQAKVALENIEKEGHTLLEHFMTEDLIEKDPDTGEYTTPLTDPAAGESIPPTPNPAFHDLFDSMHLMHKVSTLITKLRIKAEDLQWLILNFDKYGDDVEDEFITGIDFSKIPVKNGDPPLKFHSWLYLIQLLEFKARYPEREGLSVLKILENLANQNKDATFDDLNKWTEWDRTDIADIGAALQFQYSQNYKKIETYLRLAECIQYTRKSGVKAVTLLDWINPVLSSAESDQIKQAVKAKYDTEQWLKVSETLQNDIREKKRAALVDYLIANPRWKVEGDPSKGYAWDDANSMFAYFLVDVEMSSCQPTSRIKQASGSVQLFVQRCFLNLEHEVVVDAEKGGGDDTYYDEDWMQWKWMKNYRVWEANRKVFLYPENWIEPELRDDKSPFFKELENDLTQNEITDEYAEDVFLNYLEKLDDVARLEVCGVYRHSVPDTNTDVLHVIARTRSTPHIYYHRECMSGACWTAWKKIDVDIQGDHVLPVVYNRKLHLFWPIFTEKPEKDQPAQAPQLSDTPSPEAMKYWEVHLAWSIYKNRKWTPKKASKAKLIHPWPRPPHSFSFTAREYEDANKLYINIFISTSKEFNDARVGVRILANGSVETALKYPGFERHSETARPWHSSAFVFNGDVAEVRLTNIHGSYGTVRDNYGEEGRAVLSMDRFLSSRRLPNGLHYVNNSLTNNVSFWTAYDLNVIVISNKLKSGETILKGVPSRFHVVTDATNHYFDPYEVFFFQDKTRTYFAIPQTTYGSEYVTHFKTLFSPLGVPKAIIPYSKALPYEANSYTFYDFYHPYTTLFIRELNRIGIAGILNRTIQINPESFYPYNNFNFDSVYHPVKPYVSAKNTKEIVDFSFNGAYALYNWELFFHAPLLIAWKLYQNQRFEEAMKWFHYIFNPTNPSKEETPKKYWITKPFYEHNKEDYRNQKIENLLKNVNANIQDYLNQVEDWRDNPFKPHRIARFRNVAYQWTIVMKYIDNLIAWGDQLFRRDTIESINEATQMYVLAAEILGSKPIMVPPIERKAKSFNEVEEDLDQFSNVLEEYENLISVTSERTNGATATSYTSGMDSITGTDSTERLPAFRAFYFCIPPNEKLLGYWNTVADHLFKIRHCMNIEGVVRQLPLFEPPIDPALLVRAAAAGIDIGSVLNDMSAPLPKYRFTVLLQKAYDFCNYVKALGNALLSALEKKDAEKLALLRSSHEIKVLEATKTVREQQISEAKETKEGLEKTKAVIAERQKYFDKLLKSGLNAWEKAQLALMGTSTGIDLAANRARILASALKLIPNFLVGGAGAGGSPYATVQTGGETLGGSAEIAAQALSAAASLLDRMASISSTVATFTRRAEDWEFQKTLAEKELAQIEKQITAANLRWEITQKELSNIELQIENSKEVDEYMHTKYTNTELYDWMVTQISSVYFQAYKLAYDIVKRAEKAYQYEIGQYNTTFIDFGYWDSLKKGLLAGEKLELDLRRMEAAYLDQNKREYEITKHVSLAQISPLALIGLKENGTCIVKLPEILFDMNYPGHYMRRIKSISISIPCIVGPYTGINCTLTLLKNGVRISNIAGDEYQKNTDGAGDGRFKDDLAAIQSIATSSAKNDSGMFELNFRDERYLPFEGAGAISEWQIEMPREFNHFDFNTISDVIIHINYTARDGGTLLKNAAKTAVLEALPTSGVQLLDLKNEFSTEWHKFVHPEAANNDQEFKIKLTREHFPFYARNKTIEIKSMELFAQINNVSEYDVVISPPLQSTDILRLKRDSPPGQFGESHHLQHIAPNETSYPIGEWKLKMKKQGIADYRSLQPDEIQNIFMIVQFETISENG